VVFEYSNTILLEDVYRGTNGDADADMVWWSIELRSMECALLHL
jgi:hypothetical protein